MTNFFYGYKKIIFTTAAILAVVVLPIAYSLNRLSFSSSIVCWTWGPDQASVFPKNKLVQTFYPERNGLRAIVVKPLLKNDFFDMAEAQFVFRDENDNVLFSKKIRHFWMENGKMFELLVPPDLFHQEKRYSLEIIPVVEKKPGHVLGFWETNGDCYPGSLVVDGKKPRSADLAATFRYSEGSPSANLKTLFERMVQFKPLWLKNNLAFPALFGALLLAAILLLVFLAGKIKNN